MQNWKSFTILLPIIKKFDSETMTGSEKYTLSSELFVTFVFEKVFKNLLYKGTCLSTFFEITGFFVCCEVCEFDVEGVCFALYLR